MLSKVAERRMLSVRALLLAAWLVLITSLFWDPVTPALTRPDNQASPFRVTSPGLAIQGGSYYIKNTPYPMGRRLFWTMLVPIVPLFLMVLGHEAWRRVCPLSFASQIPRLLGRGRKQRVVQRRSGKVEKKLVLVGRNSWLARNSWYVQFGLLYAGLSARLLFANASTVGLAVLLLGIIGAAMLVGYLWGGKTWCNFICPINVVQKIYTEPRGLLESPAHVTRIPITQAMCRQPTPTGDKSHCIGCTTNCGDIDLERSYWDSILIPGRRHVYYMFFGLIIGFYGYYFLYAGTWDYYFSGIWTHETEPVKHMFDPGFYIGGKQWPIIKLIAAPLTLALACGTSLLLGLGLESAYRRIRNLKAATPEGEIRHHSLTVSAFLSINTFYFFGGRPNIMLMPTPVIRVIDVFIVALTTLWMLQAMQRTPMKYRREGMAAHLLETLKKLKVDVSRYLEGRTLDELKPDEVYVLTKVLPAFTHEQKVQAYGRVLDEAVTNGTTGSPATLRLLSELRTQMDITDDEHMALLDRVGTSSMVALDAKQATAFERATSVAKYQEMIGNAIVNHLEAGKSLAATTADPDILATMQLLKASFQVTPEEHARVMQSLVEDEGIVCTRLQRELDSLKLHLSCRFFLQSRRTAGSAQYGPATLLVERVEQRKHAVLLRMLSLLRALGDTDAAHAFARSMSALDAQTLSELLASPTGFGASASWEESLPPGVSALLMGQVPKSPRSVPASMKIYNFHDVITLGLDAGACLMPLMQDDDQVIQAVVLSVAARISTELGRDMVALLEMPPGGQQHSLLTETVNMLVGQPPADTSEADMEQRLRMSLILPDGRTESLALDKRSIAVGSGLANDLVVSSDIMAPYHLRLVRRDDGRLEILRLDTSPLFVNGERCDAESRLVDSPVKLVFCGPERRGPEISLEWRTAGRRVVQRVDGVTKLVWMYACPAMKGISLSKLAMMALKAEVRRYARGEQVNSEADIAFMVHAGELVPASQSPGSPAASVRAGELLTWERPTKADGQSGRFLVASDFALLVVMTEPEHVEAAVRRVWLARSATSPGEGHPPGDKGDDVIVLNERRRA